MILLREKLRTSVWLQEDLKHGVWALAYISRKATGEGIWVDHGFSVEIPKDPRVYVGYQAVHFVGYTFSP